MTKNEFEEILNKCCTQLTDEARTTVFKSSAQFENRVREVLADITENDETFQIDFNPHPYDILSCVLPPLHGRTDICRPAVSAFSRPHTSPVR